jgi:hypothetical protein
MFDPHCEPTDRAKCAPDDERNCARAAVKGFAKQSIVGDLIASSLTVLATTA